MTNYTVHPQAIVEEGASIGAGTKVWQFSCVKKGAIVGENCSLGQGTYIGPTAVLGNNIHVQNNILVCDKVTIEDDVFLGPGVIFVNDFRPRSAFPRQRPWIPTVIKEGASLGGNVSVLCGVTIGAHALVGLGAVVTKDVPAHALVVGSPAKRIGWVCVCGKRLMWNGNLGSCDCGCTYTKDGDTVEKAS